MPGPHLSAFDRVKLETLLSCGFSARKIAAELGRDPSTVYRELKRNGGARGKYRAADAQRAYNQRRKACRPAKKLADERLRTSVERGLSEEWSPEEIAERLVLEYPDDVGMHVSHETIYQHVYADKKAGGRLHEGLRQGHRKRRKRGQAKGRRGIIADRVSIHERPAVVEEQSRLGDWEGDTVIGKNHRGAVATFVDRKSLFLLAAPMPDKTPSSLNAAAIEAFRTVPRHRRHTLTLDNGLEFARFKELRRVLKTDIYFADPYRSCQRAINENTNGLLRQYLPKKTSFQGLTQAQLNTYINKLNNRPRKKLGFRTPAEVFYNRPVALRL